MYRLLLVFSGVCKYVGWRGGKKEREMEREREREGGRGTERESSSKNIATQTKQKKHRSLPYPFTFNVAQFKPIKEWGKKCFSAVRKETKYFHCQTFFWCWCCQRTTNSSNWCCYSLWHTTVTWQTKSTQSYPPKRMVSDSTWCTVHIYTQQCSHQSLK